MRNLLKVSVMLAVALLVVTLPALAGRPRSPATQCQSGQCARPTTVAMQPRYVHPVYTQPYAQPVSQPTYASPSSSSDPLSCINAARAQRGLHALAYDPNLASWAASNNAACQGRGLGHHVMAGCPQIAAGTSDPAYAVRLWTASRDHAAYLFSPSVRYVGVACSGGFSTANLR